MIVEALVAAAVVVVGNMSPHLEVDLPTLGPVVEETTGIEEIEIEIEGIEIEGIEEMGNMNHQADPIVPPIGEENAMTTAIVLVAAAAVVGNMSPHLEVDLPTLGPVVEETIEIEEEIEIEIEEIVVGIIGVDEMTIEDNHPVPIVIGVEKMILEVVETAITIIMMMASLLLRIKNVKRFII